MREANAQIVTERGFKLVARAEGHAAERAGRGRAGHRGQEPISPTRWRSRSCRRSSSRISRASSSSGSNAEVTDAEIDEALGEIAEQSRPFAAKGEGAKAENGDRVTIDFTGKIDGAPFEGGTGGDVALHHRLGHVHPGLRGAARSASAAGEKRTVKVTFPQNYPAAHLAGKDAEFDVTAKSIEAPQPVTLDDEFAKTLGLESLAKLREMRQGAARARARRRCRGRRSSASCSTSSTPAHKFDAAAEPGRGRVRQRLEDDRWTTCSRAEPHLRGRGHDRGEGARTNTAASPSGACGSAS